jgi:hypothetical protein
MDGAQTKRALPEGTIKRLHVRQDIIRANRKDGADTPALNIQTSKGSIQARTIEIHGPSTLMQSFEKPLACGARVWIETRAALTFEV